MRLSPTASGKCLSVRLTVRRASAFLPTPLETAQRSVSVLRRARGHSVADPDELRCPHEKSAFSVRDPLKQFEAYMKEMGYADDETLKAAQQKVGLHFPETQTLSGLASASDCTPTFSPCRRRR